MARVTLTDARVKALKPRRSAYEVRDAGLRGFGVRVQATGRKSYFLHHQHGGRRVWRTIGDADAMTAGEARDRAKATLVASRRGECAPPHGDGTLFEAIAETAFRGHERVWKEGTLHANRRYLKNHILPHFAGRPVADIDHGEVRAWFARLHATPATADRSLPVLSVIMGEAERMGLRPEGSNPCRGVRRHRRKGRERFLSDDELRRLSARLAAHAGRRPLQVAAIRLLLLTGCRRGEILTLRWPDYRDGRLFLRDGKTGPRTVWLSQPARGVLDGVARTGPWVFPARRVAGPKHAKWLNAFWWRVRAEAGLHDVRLHDLRHTYASLALRRGETVLAVGRLLGHRRAETTLAYTHATEAAVADAAEAVGAALGA